MSPLLSSICTFGPAILGYSVIVVGVARAVFCKAPRTRCPGPVHGWFSWRAWRSPVTLVLRRRCGYDLAGLPITNAGRCTCPECGCETHPATRVWQPRLAVVPVVVGLALVLASFALPTARYFRSGRWTNHAPTAALLWMQTALGTHAPQDAYLELTCRHTTGRLTEEQKEWLAELMLPQLRADDIPENAGMAISYFNNLPENISIPALMSVLNSDDVQQRQLAAAALRRCDIPTYPPPRDLLRVSVEGLRDGVMPNGGLVIDTLRMRTADEGVRFLIPRAAEAREFLYAAMTDSVRPDEQQQLLSAYVIAMARHGDRDLLADLAPMAAAILARHLGTNTIASDAKLATVGLTAIGPAAQPILEESMLTGDDQERRLAFLIARRIAQPRAAKASVPKADAAAITALSTDATTLTSVSDLPRIRR